jgi:hypothetical protein
MVRSATESIVYVNKIKCMSLLDSGSMAEKAISQLWGTLTCESLTEDLIGLNMFVPITTGTDLL